MPPHRCIYGAHAGVARPVAQVVYSSHDDDYTVNAQNSRMRSSRMFSIQCYIALVYYHSTCWMVVFRTTRMIDLHHNSEDYQCILHRFSGAIALEQSAIYMKDLERLRNGSCHQSHSVAPCVSVACAIACPIRLCSHLCHEPLWQTLSYLMGRILQHA